MARPGISSAGVRFRARHRRLPSGKRLRQDLFHLDVGQGRRGHGARRGGSERRGRQKNRCNKYTCKAGGGQASATAEREDKSPSAGAANDGWSGVKDPTAQRLRRRGRLPGSQEIIKGTGALENRGRLPGMRCPPGGCNLLLGLWPAADIAPKGLGQGAETTGVQRVAGRAHGTRSERAARKARRPRERRLSRASTLIPRAAAASILPSSW